MSGEGRERDDRLWRPGVRDEVDAELAFHVEMRTRELIAGGMDAAAARREAERRFGDLAAVRRACRRQAEMRERERRRADAMSELWQDLRYGVRQLRAAPGFALGAILMLALGIGATTAIFSVLHAVVLRPFAFEDPERVVVVTESWRGRDGDVSVGNFALWEAESRSFETMAAVSWRSFNLVEGDEPERVLGALVTHRFLDVFGVRPVLGRGIRPEEDVPGRDGVVVLSYGLWTTRFGADPSVPGRTIRLGERTYEVIGVMPAGFDPLQAGEQLWLPAAHTAEQRSHADNHYLTVAARLRPDVTLAGARADMERIGEVMRERFPRDNAERGARVTPLADLVIGANRGRLLVLLGAVTLVLLIACGNVANLLLARGAARGRELAVRVALGAGRGRLVRQLLTENAVLSLAAAAAGVALAAAAVRVLVAAGPAGVPRLADTRIDVVALAFALAVGLASSLVFGLVPALRASPGNPGTALRDAGRGSGTGASRDRLRGVLIAGEVALAVTLLVGAGLLIRSELLLQRVDPGFQPEGVLSARVTLPGAARDPEAVRRAFATFAEELGREPGVAAAAIVSQVPMGPGGNDNGLVPEGRPVAPESAINARNRIVTPGYFEVMRVPIVRGRAFDARDAAGASLAMIISATLAEAAWPGEDPIGRRIICCGGSPEDPMWKTVVGVAGDVRSSGLAADPRPEFYLPLAQAPPDAFGWLNNTMMLVARNAAGDAGTLHQPMREVVRRLDPTVPLYGVAPMSERVRGSTAQARFNAALLGVLGALGLLLAAAGIYSVIAYFVSLRTPEIGLRLALGASRRDVLALMARQGSAPVLTGLALGIALSLVATRLLQASLFGVAPTDPVTFGAVALVLGAVAAFAIWVPARRAARIDPGRSLHAL